MKPFVIRKSNTARPDVCLHLFKVCQKLQHELLDQRGITCLFEADSGALARWRCDAIGQIVETLVTEICQDTNARAGQITVSLHHTGQVWVLGVMDKGVRTFDTSIRFAQIASVNEPVAVLGGTSSARFNRFGATAAVVFVSRPWWPGVAELPTPMESMFSHPLEISRPSLQLSWAGAQPRLRVLN